jgi:hypothetical protein
MGRAPAKSNVTPKAIGTEIEDAFLAERATATIADGDRMSDTVRPFPAPLPMPEEERVRRLKIEVERLARLPTVERTYYLATEDYIAKFGVDDNATVRKMVEAVVKEAEKKAREDKADERHEQRRAEQKQERQEREDKRTRQDEARACKEADRIAREEEAKRKKREAVFAEIADLPNLTHETRLKEAAVRLGEDFATLVEEFGVYLAAHTIPEGLEPWPDPVDTAELFAEIEARFRR